MTDIPFRDYASFYNVKDYGAAGTGLSDDQPYIQNAVNAADTARGGIIFFPRGKYLLNSPVLIPTGNDNSFCFLGVGGTNPLGDTGSVITGNFTSQPDYLFRFLSGNMHAVASIEQICFSQTGTFTINCTDSKFDTQIKAWDPATNYNSLYNTQVYGTDNQIYTSNMASGGTNIGHDPSGGANPTYWTALGLNHATQVGGGCVYCSNVSYIRFIGCSFGVHSGIGIWSGGQNICIEDCSTQGNFAGSGDSEARCIGFCIQNGRIAGGKHMSMGTCINGISNGGGWLQANQINFEQCGYAVLTGYFPSAIFWRDDNTGRLRAASDASPCPSVLTLLNCESVMHPYYLRGGSICQLLHSGAFGGAGAYPSDAAFTLTVGGNFVNCYAEGAYSKGAWDLDTNKPAYKAMFDNCSAPVSSGTGWKLPSGPGAAPLEFRNCDIDGGMLFANLPAGGVRGAKMRCSNSNVAAVGNFGTALTSGNTGGGNSVEVSWNGSAWAIVGP